MRDTEFLKHAEGNSEGISKFLLLKTTSTQEAKMKMLNAFKTNVYFLLNCAIFRDYSDECMSTDVEEQDGEYYKYMRSKFIRTTSHCHLYP